MKRIDNLAGNIIVDWKRRIASNFTKACLSQVGRGIGLSLYFPGKLNYIEREI